MLHYLGPFSFFEDQLHRGLKEIHVQANHTVQLAQLPMVPQPLVAVLTHQLSHEGAVFLFDVALIVFLVGSASSEGDFFARAVGPKTLI